MVGGSQEERLLEKVVIFSDVHTTCLTHALSTEKQEVMGLLIGDVNEETRISYISACLILHRSDKQPDRVEISPEQLYKASMYAEELTKTCKREMRVLGWYHSHPHITVWPSHVDVRTQKMYQVMDKWFVGLIYAVYQNDSGSTSYNFKLTCFQAVNTSDSLRREVPIEVRNSCLHRNNLKNMVSLPRILVQEEEEGQDLEREIDSKNDDILVKLHNDALRTSSMVHIISKVAMPMCESLQNRWETVNLRIRELEKAKKALLED